MHKCTETRNLLAAISGIYFVFSVFSTRLCTALYSFVQTNALFHDSFDRILNPILLCFAFIVVPWSGPSNMTWLSVKKCW